MHEANVNIGILFQLDDGADFDRRLASVCKAIGVNLNCVKVLATNDGSAELAQMVIANHPWWQVSINKGKTRLVELAAGDFNNLEEQV
ncbi:MAG: hypothetical protein LKJ29_06655 [Lactobacillus sp.]|jgi:hypothetical protein|uniref:Uncharacterized protein n=1 Tax=Lacticaseibacillus suilingensis TaxID=2799577 RepID=A0ABW4BID8_9LACO|nr:hypothetical protein [Lacticaseibacillus suilingensis]MCI1895139.1 hypothetical protein [Lactobacillus sp.]MCI1941715.1 hypothetical protein [Lactobacillus sp.]MCI1972348.1 hypothetical protein [Lactobacillus sp.]MCI2038278.1 hypothetical protein [Lactobacillus sp.]